MSKVNRLPEEERRALAGRVSPWLQPHRHHLAHSAGPKETAVPALPSAPHLAEGFEIWTLDCQRMTDPVRIRHKSTFASEWHHQIRWGSNTPLSVRAVRPAQDVEWMINAVFEEPMTGNIDRAVTWLDSNVHDDDIAHLLQVPLWFRLVLWLEGADRDRLVAIDPIDLDGGRFEAADAATFLGQLVTLTRPGLPAPTLPGTAAPSTSPP